MKAALQAVVVVVVGAVLGSFLGGFLSTIWPSGKLHDLLAKELSAGLQPATLNLRIVDVTLGGHIHLNVLSIVGVVLAAVLYKKLLR